MKFFFFLKNSSIKINDELIIFFLLRDLTYYFVFNKRFINTLSRHYITYLRICNNLHKFTFKNYEIPKRNLN